MKGTVKDWLKVLVLLLDEAAAVALIILVLWVLDVEIPLPVMIPVALVLGALIFLIHKAVIPTFHKERVVGAEVLIGLEGKVTKPLTPVGVIRVKDEYWKAKSVGGNIDAGDEVEILGRDGLVLTVKLKNQ